MRTCTLSCAVEPPFIPIRQHPIISLLCDLFACVRESSVCVYIAQQQNRKRTRRINSHGAARLPVILFSCESVKFPSMWKFYFAVDKNMRARRQIKKRLASVIVASLYCLVRGANSVRNIAQRRLSIHLCQLAIYFILYMYTCVGAKVVFSLNTPGAQSRKYE